MAHPTFGSTAKALAQAAYARMPTTKTTVKALVTLTALGALSYAAYTYRAPIGAALAKGYAIVQPKLANVAARARTVITSEGAIKAYKYGAAALVVLTAGYYAKKKVDDILFGLSLHSRS